MCFAFRLVYVLITAVFFYTTAANMIERPDGIKIASCFIVAIVVCSFGSRLRRSTELRFRGFEFADQTSQFLWDSMKHLEFPVLVPHRPGRRGLAEKEADHPPDAPPGTGRADRVHRGGAGRPQRVPPEAADGGARGGGAVHHRRAALRLDRARDRHDRPGVLAASASRPRSTSAGPTKARWPPTSASCSSAKATSPGWSAS